MKNRTIQEAFARQTVLLERHTQKSSFLEAPIEAKAQTNIPESRKPKTIRSLCRSDYIIMGLGLLLIPALAFGADAYGTALLKTEATNLQGLLFGPVLRIAGVIGAVFGIIRAFQTQTLQPIFIFGGIGAATIIVPKLLDVMFKVT